MHPVKDKTYKKHFYLLKILNSNIVTSFYKRKIMSLFLNIPGFPPCNGQTFGTYTKGYLKQKVAHATAQFITAIESGATVM